MGAFISTPYRVALSDIEDGAAYLRARGFDSYVIARCNDGIHADLYGRWVPPNAIGGPVLAVDEVIGEVPKKWRDWADGVRDEIMRHRQAREQAALFKSTREP